MGSDDTMFFPSARLAQRMPGRGADFFRDGVAHPTMTLPRQANGCFPCHHPASNRDAPLAQCGSVELAAERDLITRYFSHRQHGYHGLTLYRLFHRYALGEVSGFIHIAAAGHGGVIGQ